jgi:phospholipid/cholesterol/gamma-HCH transport system substrate-binding protein
MDERVMQFRVGASFLAALIFAGILLVLFGKLPTYIGSYPVKVEFDNAVGISKGSPVRKSGMLIGRVAGVELTHDDRAVLVTLDIQKGKSIFQDEKCSIRRDLMGFGDTAIVVEHTPDEGRHTPIDVSSIQIGEKTSSDPTGLKKVLQEPIDRVERTGDALTAASKKLGAAADRVREILDTENQNRVNRILDNTDQSLEVIKNALGDKENQQRLADSLRKLPRTIEKMNDTFEDADTALRKFTQSPPGSNKPPPIDRLVSMIDRMEQTLRKFTESSDGNQPPPIDQIAKAVDNINEITELMRNIMSRIDKGEGTLGALLKDRQLYNRLDRAAGNIEQLTRELRPIIDDAGVFMDKAARHPGGIIRDAIKPGPGIK